MKQRHLHFPPLATTSMSLALSKCDLRCVQTCFSTPEAMFSRPSGLASRIAFTALLLIVSTYLLYNRHLLQTSTVRFDSLLDDLHGYTDKHLEYFFQDGTTDENGFHARILRFWVELQEILGEVRPDIRPIKPMEAHIEQSFEENWPDLVHEQKISLPSRDVKKLKESHAAMLTHIKQLASTLPYRKKTRGVVTTAGAKYINPLLISLRMLRRAGSQLPVEVFFDTRTSQTNRICAKILPKLQAECVFFSDIWAATADTVEPMQTLKSYQLKVFALLFSSFEEVLFFDADAFPARNPDHMLRVDPFIALGLVTWPDFWSITSSPTFWQIAGVDVGVAKKESDARASTESGVMLVSKEKHARTLLLAAYYNYYGPECYYPLLSQGAQGEG
jgi:alpha 1,2-mannosyltransferase